MTKLFIGIDISKSTLDIAYCDSTTKEILKTFQVVNSFDGICRLIKELKKILKKQTVWVCFEHTGNYGLLLSFQLDNAGIPYSAISALEIKKSQGLTRGKNDQIDAQRISLYAATQEYKLKPTKLPSVNLLKIKTLLTFREQLSRISVQYQNSLKAYRLSAEVIKIDIIIQKIVEEIKRIKLSMIEVESKIEELINDEIELKTNFDKVKSVNGIGKITAAYLIYITSNFTYFENARKFNCYAGIAPFEHTSGSSIKAKTKTSQLRNRTMKRILFNCANVAIQYDGQLKTYYKRKKEEGKAHMSIVNAVACKLIYRIYAVVNRDTPFVNFVQ